MIKRTCVQCGKEFTLTNSEIRFFKSKNLNLPKRCKECRSLNREKAGDPLRTEVLKNNAGNDKNKAANASPVKPEGSHGSVIGMILIVLAVIVAVIAVIFSVFKFSAKKTDTDASSESAQVIVAETENEATTETENVAKTETTAKPETTATSESTTKPQTPAKLYSFRYKDRLDSHFKKHGNEVGAKTATEYLEMANAVISDPNALTKYEAEDGDKIYFLKDTGEIVFLSTDGYIRTYFIADYDYFNRQ
ncbi:MAG: zinc-ribbon domain containing protein [Clostridiales bacterium]|nr:zinc-ribbon domain containing protein [Clostridiales bacterium]